MNILEAKQKWRYSADTIRQLCQYGFIPSAEKKRIWKLPDDAEKPPVTVNAFIVLMESIAEIMEGGNPNVYRKGLPKEIIDDALYYLSGYGFISGYDRTLQYPDSVKKVRLLPKSYYVIKRYRGKNNLPRVEKNMGISAGFGNQDFNGLNGKIHVEKKISY